jgi:hypothetical protein
MQNFSYVLNEEVQTESLGLVKFRTVKKNSATEYAYFINFRVVLVAEYIKMDTLVL